MPPKTAKSSAKSSKQPQRPRGKRGGKPLPLVTIMPSAKRVLQTFAFPYTLSEPAANASNFYFFRLNSVYDPDSSGVGSSASGYSTWSSLFLNYRVRNVTVRVQGHVTGLTLGSRAEVYVIPLAYQAVLPGNSNYWMAAPHAKCYTVNDVSYGGRNAFSHIATYNQARLARITAAQFNDDMDWSGVVGSNPARMNYLAIAFRGLASGAPSTLNYSIQITYQVEWFNPVPMQS